MKKIVFMLSIITTVFIFVACGINTEVNNTFTLQSTVDNQIQIILSQRDNWKVYDESDTWGYAVTDLNQNGRLELIASECHGSGLYSTTRIFEVNESYDFLVDCTGNLYKGESQPDYLLLEEYKAFEADGAYYLIAEDLIKDGVKCHYYCDYLLGIRDGAVEMSFLRERMEEYANDDTIFMFYDSDENRISEEEYHSIIDNLYKGSQKYKVKIGWCYDILIGEYTGEEMKDMLLDSYNMFQLVF